MSDRTLFYRSCSAPGFAFAWLWRCRFGLSGIAEFRCESGNGTGCATVEAGAGAVGTDSRQLSMLMPESRTGDKRNPKAQEIASHFMQDRIEPSPLPGDR